MRRYGTSLFAAVFGIVIYFGCGAQKDVRKSYDAEKDRTQYRTRPYTVSEQTRLGGGIAAERSKSITVEAVAQCSGVDCTPNVIRLLFKAKGGDKLQVTGAGGQIVADESQFKWSSVEAGGNPTRGGGRFYTVKGRFATVDLSLEEFRTITSASSVGGAIGGLPLEFDDNTKSGFQTFLRKF